METVFSAYDKVWVITHKGMYDIDKIYIDKEEAEQACRKQNQNYNDYFTHNKKDNYYIVKSLDDTIDIIKESIDDDRNEEVYFNDTLKD